MRPLYKITARRPSPRRKQIFLVTFAAVAVIVLYIAVARDGVRERDSVPAGESSAASIPAPMNGDLQTVTSRTTPTNGHETLPVLNTAHIRPPQITSPSAILIDANSGLVLYEKSDHTKREIASLTKIMTAMLAYEMGSTADTYTASSKSAEAGGSELYLEPGEKLSGQDMFYALMLRSANDVSIALAESLAGSESSFVKLMNERTRALGLTDTEFFNPHGLGGNMSTAYDMAVISREAMKDPFFAKVVGTKRYEIAWPGKPYPRSAENHNRILGKYPFIIGVKTGFTDKAGYCLAGAAEKDGVRVISVVLGAKTAAEVDSDTLRLLEHAFNNFSSRKLVSSNTPLLEKNPRNAPMFKFEAVSTSDVIFLDLKKRPQLAVEYRIDDNVDAPLIKGQKVGEAVVIDGGTVVAVRDLVSNTSVNAPNFIDRITYILSQL